MEPEREPQSPSRGGAELQARAAPTLARACSRGLLGYDFFISYARQDGTEYAVALERGLTERGFVVFRDETGLDGGERLSVAVQSAARKARRLIVIGTRAALDRPWISAEVELFTSRKAEVVPVDIDDIRGSQTWVDAADVLFVTDIGARTPSQPAFERIVAGMLNQRVIRRVRRVVLGVGIAVVATAVFLLLRVREAHLQRERSDTIARAARAAEQAAALEESSARHLVRAAGAEHRHAYSEALAIARWLVERLPDGSPTRRASIEMVSRSLGPDHTHRHVLTPWLPRDRSPILQVAWSGSGRILATLGRDDTVRTWSTESGEEIGVEVLPTSSGRAIAFADETFVKIDHKVPGFVATGAQVLGRESKAVVTYRAESTREQPTGGSYDGKGHLVIDPERSRWVAPPVRVATSHDRMMMVEWCPGPYSPSCPLAVTELSVRGSLYERVRGENVRLREQRTYLPIDPGTALEDVKVCGNGVVLIVTKQVVQLWAVADSPVKFRELDHPGPNSSYHCALEVEHREVSHHHGILAVSREGDIRLARHTRRNDTWLLTATSTSREEPTLDVWEPGASGRWQYGPLLGATVSNGGLLAIEDLRTGTIRSRSNVGGLGTIFPGSAEHVAFVGSAEGRAVQVLDAIPDAEQWSTIRSPAAVKYDTVVFQTDDSYVTIDSMWRNPGVSRWRIGCPATGCSDEKIFWSTVSSKDSPGEGLRVRSLMTEEGVKFLGQLGEGRSMEVPVEFGNQPEAPDVDFLSVRTLGSTGDVALTVSINSARETMVFVIPPDGYAVPVATLPGALLLVGAAPEAGVLMLHEPEPEVGVKAGVSTERPFHFVRHRGLDPAEAEVHAAPPGSHGALSPRGDFFAIWQKDAFHLYALGESAAIHTSHVGQVREVRFAGAAPLVVVELGTTRWGERFLVATVSHGGEWRAERVVQPRMTVAAWALSPSGRTMLFLGTVRSGMRKLAVWSVTSGAASVLYEDSVMDAAKRGRVLGAVFLDEERLLVATSSRVQIHSVASGAVLWQAKATTAKGYSEAALSPGVRNLLIREGNHIDIWPIPSPDPEVLVRDSGKLTNFRVCEETGDVVAVVDPYPDAASVLATAEECKTLLR